MAQSSYFKPDRSGDIRGGGGLGAGNLKLEKHLEWRDRDETW